MTIAYAFKLLKTANVTFVAKVASVCIWKSALQRGFSSRLISLVVGAAPPPEDKRGYAAGEK